VRGVFLINARPDADDGEFRVIFAQDRRNER
jgi:hypothetical protein